MNAKHPSRGMVHPARGMTLLELLIALAITVVTGLAIASVTTAIARGLSTVNTARSALQRAHAAHVRLRAYTDPSRCVLECDPDRGFALWLDDSRMNQKVNLTEMRVFWFSPDDGLIKVERVVFPAGWPPEDYIKYDTVVTTADDPFALMVQHRDLGYTQTETLADGVDSLDMTYSTNDVRDAHRVRLGLTVRMDDGQPQELLLALGLPNHAAPE